MMEPRKTQNRTKSKIPIKKGSTIQNKENIPNNTSKNGAEKKAVKPPSGRNTLSSIKDNNAQEKPGKSKRAKDAPDFRKLHEKWETKLAKGKAVTKRANTQIEPFKLTKEVKTKPEKTDPNEDLSVVEVDEPVEMLHEESEIVEKITDTCCSYVTIRKQVPSTPTIHFKVPKSIGEPTLSSAKTKEKRVQFVEDQFEFKPDNNALQSILNNDGIRSAPSKRNTGVYCSSTFDQKRTSICYTGPRPDHPLAAFEKRLCMRRADRTMTKMKQPEFNNFDPSQTLIGVHKIGNKFTAATSSEEINELKQNLVHALEAKSGSQEEQLSLVQKSSEMSSELVALQSKLRDEEQKRISLEKSCEGMKRELVDRMKTIDDSETQLGQRPTAEHVSSLQTHVNSLEEQLKTTKHEKESEKVDLSEKYQNADENTKRLEAKVNELVIEKSSKVEQLESLQTAFEAASDYRKQVEENQGEKQKLVLSIQHELNQANVAVKEKEQFVEFLQKQLEETKENYQIELNAKDEAKQEVRRLQNLFEEQERQSNTRESKLIEVEISLVQTKADISRMEEERNKLIQKIEAGEGINTAINQLNLEKDQLEERLQDCEKQMETQARESAAKIEELHKQNNEITEELEKYKQNESKLSVSLKEKSDELEILSGNLEETKSELQKKSELLVAAEASKVAEKNVLEEQRMSVQETLQQRIAEHSALQQEHALIKEQLSSYKEETITLQSQVSSFKNELDSKTKQCSELESELVYKSSSLAAIQERNDLVGSHKIALRSHVEEMNTIKEKHKMNANQNAAKITSLEQEKLQLEVKLNALSTSVKEKEEELSVAQTNLTKIAEEKGALQEKLDTNLKILEERSTEIKQISREFEVTKLKSEEKTRKIENLKSQVNQVQQEKALLEAERANDGKVHQEKIDSYESKVHEYNDRIEKKAAECQELQNSVDRKDERLQEHCQRIEVKDRMQEKRESPVIVEQIATFQELTAEMNDIVDKALGHGALNELLVDLPNGRITRKDIMTLQPQIWLNDEVVNAYFNMISKRSMNSGPKVYAFNTFFYPNLLKTGHAGTSSWTKKVDLFAMDIVLIPVYLGMHWCLAVIDIKRKTFTYYDSLKRDNPECIQALRDYICAESLDKKNTSLDLNGWKNDSPKDIPEQLNGCDCGVFVCKYGEYVSRRAAFNFTQHDMPYFRRSMVFEILNKKLL